MSKATLLSGLLSSVTAWLDGDGFALLSSPLLLLLLLMRRELGLELRPLDCPESLELWLAALRPRLWLWAACAEIEAGGAGMEVLELLFP